MVFQVPLLATYIRISSNLPVTEKQLYIHGQWIRHLIHGHHEDGLSRNNSSLPGSLFFKGRQFVGNVAWQLGTRTTTSTQSQNATMQTKVTYPKLHVSEQSPNIESFGQLLTVYNKRELTYSADTLNATGGILSSLVPGIHTSEPLNLI
jgi:hypothetical protein